MKIKIIKKRTGYFVGIGELTKKQKLAIEKIVKQDGNKQEIWLIEQSNKKLKKYVKTKNYEYWIYWD